ncbi:MAG: restriction endonuclease subunit S [Christensenellales bacterium]
MGEWKTASLIEFADVIPSNVDKVLTANEIPVYLCNYMDAYSNRFIRAGMSFSPGTVRQSELGRFRLRKGDVIVTKDSETPDDIGIPAVISDEIDNLVCGYHLAVIRADQSKYNGTFLMYALQAENPVRYFSTMCNGITRYGLTLDALQRQKVFLPNEKIEQTKIAEILYVVDDAIDKTRALIDKYVDIKAGLMQDLLGKGDEVRLGDKRYFEINPRNTALPTSFYYVDLESVVAGDLLQHNIVTRSTAPSRAQRILRCKDILFQMVRPYQQNNYFFEYEFDLPAVASTGYAQIRTTQNPKFLYYALHTEKVLRNVVARCTGSNYPAINSTELKRVRVVLPSVDEQGVIAEQLTSADKKIQTEQAYLAKLQDIKRGLMHDLLTNKVSVDALM